MDYSKLYDATINRLQVDIVYKKGNGEIVRHTGGIVEIRGEEFYFWDTIKNDHIRRMKFNRIKSFRILKNPFIYTEFPIIINGEIV